MGLFDRFRKAPKAEDLLGDLGDLVPPSRRPLIGAELFPDKPQTPREILRPHRTKMQEEYRAEGRDPDTIGRIPPAARDESLWMTYIDSLMLFEREQEAWDALQTVVDRYPDNPNFREMRMLLARTWLGSSDFDDGG